MKIKALSTKTLDWEDVFEAKWLRLELPSGQKIEIKLDDRGGLCISSPNKALAVYPIVSNEIRVKEVEG